MCLIYIPAAVFVANYFLERRILALCIVTCSVPVGFLFIPWLTVRLIDSLGWRLTLAIFSCFCMQVKSLIVVCSPLARIQTWVITVANSLLTIYTNY